MPFPYYFLCFLLNFICVFSSTTSAGRQTDQENDKTTHDEEINSEMESLVETTLSSGDEKNVVIDYSQCGKSERKTYNIGGGKDALLGDWPWMVALGYIKVNNTKPQFLCSGTLISDDWIITAAHCVIVEKEMLIIARVGDLNLNDHGEDKATPLDIPILEMYPHPNYTDSPVVTNDIALLKLAEKVDFQELIRSVCLPSEDEHMDDQFYNGQNLYVLGWGCGRNNGSASKSNSLQEAVVEILDTAQCKQTFLRRKGRIWSSTIDHRVLCATSKKADVCEGDSGGPMIMQIGATYYLAGVTSYGKAVAGDILLPTVFTRVSVFSGFIMNVTEYP